MLAFELIVGRPPFERESRSSTYEAIMYRRPHFPLWISDSAREFITLALVKVRVHMTRYGMPSTWHLRYVTLAQATGSQ